MPTYAYACDYDGPFDKVYDRFAAPDIVACPTCAEPSGLDFSSIKVVNDDPFRKAWLSPKMEQELSRQGRALDSEAPKDKFEAKERHQRLGRVYIGDDMSSLKPKSQQAIIRGNSVKPKNVLVSAPK